MQTTYGMAHLLSQTDAVGKLVLLVLVAMSVASWYYILVKGVHSFLLHRRANRFLQLFWETHDLEALRIRVRQAEASDPFSVLARAGFAAAEQYQRQDGSGVIEASSADVFLTHALDRSIQRTTRRLESGLTLLASVGSAAPFVGLFGTVWGVYHALLAIGLSGQGTLDKVAGPVGEALLMTALGLAVAIPAVLGYNALVRSNRVILADLTSFAHDMFGFMSTGHRAATVVDLARHGARDQAAAGRS